MQIKVSKKRKRLIAVYLLLLLVLYVVIYILPKITDIFETTQILEPGVLEISCETEGYIVKDEAVVLADKTGDMVYLNRDGTVVKKGSGICDIEATDKGSGEEKAEIDVRYSEYLDKLKNYDGLYSGEDSPISGIFSTSIDGGEKYFSIDNLDNIKKDKAESFDFKEIDLSRKDVVEGEPVYKITGDDHWYALCWIDSEEAEEYEEGDYVTLSLPAGDVKARLQEKQSEKSDGGKTVRMVFYMNRYYAELASVRKEKMTITMTNSSGLLVDNECLISREGQIGVYVKTKDDVYVFKPVNIKASNSKQSVISDGTYVNEDYEQVTTVNVYDEVLRNPQSALEEEQAAEKNSEKDK